MVLENVWQEFLNIIREEVGSRVVETWFKAVTFTHWDSYGKTAYLQTPNSFIKEWLLTNYQKLLKLHLGRLLHETEFRLIFLDQNEQQPVKAPEVALQTAQIEKAPIPARPKNALTSHYRFENFIIGQHNELAFAAAQAVCDQPGNLYNPLVIHGDSGLGKTHMAHAIAYQIKATYPQSKVVFQAADRFVSEFIHAIRFDKFPFFEQKYKNVDVLIIDDIHYIANKEQTQEAFFHLFNALYEGRKQIICTAPCPPANIKGISERLLSRLQSGFIADIVAPDLEAKIAIIQLKARLHNATLDQDIVEAIASGVACNIRDIEGVLIRILAFSTLTKQPLSVALVHKVMNRVEIATQAPQIKPDMQRIAQKVTGYYDCTLEDMRSDKRLKHITFVRHVTMYFIKKLTNKSLTDIALFFRRKDHTTVLHAVSKIEAQKSNDQELGKSLETIEKQIFE